MSMKEKIIAFIENKLLESTVEIGYEDDLFKLPTDNLPKGVVVRWLKDILEIGSSIRETKYKDGIAR